MTVTIDGTTGVSLVQDGVVTAADLASGAITASALPAGSVLQVVSESFNVGESTTSTSYQSSAINMTVQKKRSDSRLLVIMAGGHQYLNNYANGCISTLCQESSSSTFTASTTYDGANDPVSGLVYGMQQVYNASALNTAPHSKNWLFASSGNEFEAFRAFFKSRFSAKTAVFAEGGHAITMTIMEIAQ